MRKPAQSPENISAVFTPLQTVMHIVTNASCIFAGCSLTFLLIKWAVVGSFDEAAIYMDTFLLLYVMSLGFAAANAVRRSQRMPLWSKCILHPLLSLGGVFCVYCPYMQRNGFPVGTVMVHFFAFALGYGFVMLVIYLCALLARKIKRGEAKEKDMGASLDAAKKSGVKAGKKADKEAYTPLFSRKDEEK